MAIQNINNIQSGLDFSNSNIDINYLVQALANLGQREGIKGSGIIYDYFTPVELGNITNNANYIILSKNKKDGNIYYKNLDFIDKNWTSNIRFNDIQNISSINNKILNNISLYKNNVLYIHNNDNNLYHFCCGDILGTNKSEIIYNKFDLKNNILEYALRSFYLYNDGISNYYCLLEIEKDENSVVIVNDSSNAINYKLTLYLFNSSYFDEISDIRNTFEKCYLNNNDLNNNDLIINLKNNLTNIKNSQLYLLFNNYDVNNHKFTISNLYYNTESNCAFSIITDLMSVTEKHEYESIKNELDKELGLDNRIFFLNNDVLYLYPKLLQLYNEDILNKQSNKYKFILDNIFEHIYNSLDTEEQENFELYIPKDYKFRFQCDSQNNYKIYNSDNNYIVISDKKPDLSSNSINNNLYCYCGETSECKIINLYYEIEYNSIYNDYVIGINIETLYALPYINYKNNWSLYDGDTNISAVGKDGGNPNIIIMYNYKDPKTNELKNKIVSSVYNDKLEACEMLEGNFQLYENDFFTTDRINNILTAQYQLPKITKNNFDFLTFATIILITDVSCINSYNLDNHSVKYLTSIWSVNTSDKHLDNNDYHQFNYIGYDINNRNVIFNFNKLFNIQEFVSKELHDIFEYGVRIKGSFIDNIKLTNDKLTNTSDKLLFEYLNGEDLSYNNGYMYYSYENNGITYFISSNSFNKVNNDSNIFLKFKPEIDTLIENDNRINSSYLMNKNSFRNNPQVDKNIFVNSTYNLYPKFAYESSTNRNRTVYYPDYVLNSTYNNYSKIYVGDKNGNEKLYVSNDGQYEQGIDLYTEKIVYAYDIVFDNKSNYYEEYTFDNNIPTLNLSSLFLQDINVINRVNIISVAKSGLLYNAYIGSDFNSKDKRHFVIGTSTKNINVNNTYLVSYENSSKFAEQLYLDINFHNIKIGNSSYISIDNDDIIISKHDNNGTVSFELVDKINAIDNVIRSITNVDDASNKFIEYDKYGTKIKTLEDFVNKDYNTSYTGIKSDITELQTKCSELITNFSTISFSIQDIERIIGELKNNNPEDYEYVSGTPQDINKIEKSIQSLEGNFSNISKDISKLKEDVKELKGKIDNFDTSNNFDAQYYDTEISKLKNEILALRRDLHMQ